MPSFTLVNNPSEPGTIGTPAFFMVSLAEALSPIELICAAVAPMNLMPYSAQMAENLAFSDKNP